MGAYQLSKLCGFVLWMLLVSFCADKENTLVVLVDARKLDYSRFDRFVQTLAKHPSDKSKNGDIGHAWIILKGWVNGEWIEIEGGHSQKNNPGYIETLFLRAERGDPNPAMVLHQSRRDGFFEKGSGGHKPTCKASFPLTNEQFEKALYLLLSYPFEEYSLKKQQCCSFVIAMLQTVGISVQAEQTLQIPDSCFIGRTKITLWQDPKFSTLTLPTPEALEKALLQSGAK